MKNILFLFLFLVPVFLFAQYPTGTNKSRLGYQTTGDGLIWRGVAADTAIKPRTTANAYFQLDTVNRVLRRYIATQGSWQVVGATPDLSAYLLKSDTAAMLVKYIERGDTATMLARYIERGDTASMLTNYPSTVGYGILKSSKTIRADTTSPNGLATRLFAKMLPTSILAEQVAYSNGSNLVGSSNLIWNNTNGRLGVGTASPSLDFDITKNANTLTGINILNTNTGNGVYAVIELRASSTPGRLANIAKFGDNVPSAQTRNPGDLAIYNGAGIGDITLHNDFPTGKIKFTTNASASVQMTLAATGNLLLGTTTDVPTSILTARSTTKSSSPFPFHTTAESNAIIGVAGNFEWLTDGLGPGFSWHNGTRKAYGLESTANIFNEGRIIHTNSNWQATGNANLTFTIPLGLGIISDGSAIISAQGSVQTGARSNFAVATSGLSRPGATEIRLANQRFATAYDNLFFFSSQSSLTSPLFIVTSASGFTPGAYSQQGFFLGATTGPNNVSLLQINASNSSEYNQAGSYASGSNYYQTNTLLTSPLITSNTGQLAVRANYRIGGRALFLTSDQGVVLSNGNPTSNITATAAALDIQSTTQGFLPPRLVNSSSLRYGIASVVVINGGSGYGTGTGVVINFSGGGGQGAAISLTYSGGVVTSGSVILKGSGYSTAPTVTLTGGTGTGAVIAVTLETAPTGLTYYQTDGIEGMYVKAASGFKRLLWEGDAANGIISALPLADVTIDANFNSLTFTDVDAFRVAGGAGTEVYADSTEFSVTNPSINLETGGSSSMILDEGNARATLRGDDEVVLSGKVRALQEHYFTITSTSSPQTLSSTYSDNLINQGGTQATFTLNMPASPDDGQVCYITFNNAISTLTIDGNGETIVGSAVTTGVPGSQRKFKFYTGIGWIKQY